MKRKIIGIFVSMLLIGTSGMALADWVVGDGHKMHFPQLPDPNGIDVDFHDWMLADDWKCSESGSIKEIHFWYSWAQDEVQNIPWVKVAIYSNNPGPPSMPFEEQWTRTFDIDDLIIAGPFTGVQSWYHPPDMFIPNDHTTFYQMNIMDIPDPYGQEEDTIYWLVIQMPYYSFPYPAVGWKTSNNHYEDNAVYGMPTSGWTPLWDPRSPNDPIDFAFVINGAPPHPDLVCDGALSWFRVKPGDAVNGNFGVANNGDIGSLLDWEIASYPAWGSWSFLPASGTGLPVGTWITVNVTVIAPTVQNDNYSGQVTIVNKDDSTDTCTIDVVLETPESESYDSVFGWTIIRGFVGNIKKEGNDLYFRAIRLHYSEITGMESSFGVIKLKRCRVSDMGSDRMVTFGPLGSFTWIFAISHGGLTEL